MVGDTLSTNASAQASALLEEIASLLSVSAEEKERERESEGEPVFCAATSYASNTMLTLRERGELSSDKSLLLKVVQDSLRTEFRSAEPLKVSLILKGGEIHSLVFAAERDYWRFLCGLRCAPNNNNNSNNRGPLFVFEGLCELQSSSAGGSAAKGEEKKKNKGTSFFRSRTDANAPSSKWRFRFHAEDRSVSATPSQTQTHSHSQRSSLTHTYTLTLTNATTDKNNSRTKSGNSSSGADAVSLSLAWEEIVGAVLSHDWRVPAEYLLEMQIPLSLSPSLASPATTVQLLCGERDTETAQTLALLHCAERNNAHSAFSVCIDTHAALALSRETWSLRVLSLAHTRTEKEKDKEKERTIEDALLLAEGSACFSFSPSLSRENTLTACAETERDLHALSALDRLSVCDALTEMEITPRREKEREKESTQSPALRLLVRRAENLFLSHTQPASRLNAYCTAYLVDEHGTRLSHTHSSSSSAAEQRTESVRGESPQWDRELVLPLVEGARAVLLLVRDGTGIVKHRHLGQASVPIECFLDDAAELCLPLEPTRKMDSSLAETAYLGEIHVSTQHILVDTAQAQRRRGSWANGTASAAATGAVQNTPPTIAADNINSNRNKGVQCVARLRRLSPLRCWLPCVRIDATASTVASTAVAAVAEPYWMQLTSGALLLRTAKTHTESAQHTQLSESLDEDLIFSYDQVESFFPVTSATLYVRLVVSEGNSERAAFVIAPCDSYAVAEALRFRVVHTDTCKLLEQSLHTAAESEREARACVIAAREAALLLQRRSCDLQAVDWSHYATQRSVSWEAQFLAIAFALLRRRLCALSRTHSTLVPSTFADNELLPELALCLSRRELNFDWDINWLEEFASALSAVTERVRVFLLCCEEDERRATDATAHAEAVRVFLQKNHTAARAALDSLLSSRSDFERIPSLEFKYALLRFALRSGRSLQAEMDALLSLSQHTSVHARVFARLVTSLDLSLVSATTLEALPSWFAHSVARDVSRWVVRTIHAAQRRSGDREGENALSQMPWEWELLGDACVSHIPESVQMQLVVYRDLRIEDAWLGDSLARASFSLMDLQRMSSRAAVANFDVHAITLHAWVFVAREYERALQSRHWDELRDGEEDVIRCLSFLSSVANDALRVRDNFLRENDVFGVDTVLIEEELESVERSAVRRMTKVVYACASQSLLELGERWFDTHSQASAPLLKNLSVQLRRAQTMCKPSFFAALVSECFSVLSLRFLLMFRERLASNHALNAEDVLALRHDAEEALSLAQELFAKTTHNTANSNANNNGVSVPKSALYLQHFAHLIAEEADSTAFNASLLWTLRLYDLSDQTQLWFAEVLLLQCVLPLRYDAEGAYQTMMAVLSSPANLEKYASHVNFAELSGDLFFRVFGSLCAPQTHPQAQTQTQAAKSLSLTNSLRQLQPSVALKQLREKASNLVLSAEENYRRNEDSALTLMRALGLERDREREKDAQQSSAVRSNAVLAKFFDDDTLMDMSRMAEDRSGQKRPSIKALFDGLSAQKSITMSTKQQPTPASSALSSSSSRRGQMLEIRGLAVRGLLSFSVMGEANPYVYFSLGDERVKSSVKWNHRDAQWDEVYSLPVSSAQLSTGSLLVEVYDKERIRRKRLLGSVSVKLQSLLLHPDGSWFALEGGDKSSFGEIHLQLSVVHAPTSS